MSKIDFISIPKLSFHKEKIIHFLRHYADNEGYKISHIQYNFVDKSAMLKINNQHLKHDNHTDIITFDYSVKKSIKAEVYISVEMMNKNAKLFGQTIDYEAVRLISHALFHCMGYSDKSNIEKSKMREMEDRFIRDVSRETINNV